MNERRIVQISVATFHCLGFTIGYRMWALCDDGSIWYRDPLEKDAAGGWKHSIDSPSGPLLEHS